MVPSVGEEACEPDEEAEPVYPIGDVCACDCVNEERTDEEAFEDTVISVALLDDLELGGTYRDADHMPLDPRTDRGVDIVPGNEGEEDGSEEVVVDTVEVEAALMT